MKKLLLAKPLLLILFIFRLSFHQSINAQDTSKEIQEKLIEFQSTPKETAYLHLNKSILLQGEQLGFSAYIINQQDLKPSLKTTNLYVQVKDSNDKVVKEKMLLVENGTASNTFDIDSTFSKGTYSITAFTNWMRNFDQQNFFTEKIQILESDSDYKEKKVDKLQKLDAQFLPESGHLLNNVVNNLGIIIKDSLGYGLSKANVRILNQDNKMVAYTRLNQLGIGKVSLIPDVSEQYTALINFKGREFSQKISTKIERRGVTINTNNQENELQVTLNTNLETQKSIEGTPFILTIQNPNKVIAYQIDFNNATSVLVPVPYKELNSGINIITLFNSDKKPLAERLIFNHKNLPIVELDKPIVQDRKDSIQLSLPTGKIADSTFLSVSILPEKTISDKRNHNIISYLMLQPHLKGTVENASWYFKDIDGTKKEALDNLLLTQGWSSYNWRNIFEGSRELNYGFENYIDLKANINNNRDKEQRFLIHASSTNAPTFVEVPEGKDAFIFEGIKPLEGENLFISRVKNNDKLTPAGLSVQFFPNHIEDFKHSGESLAPWSHLYSVKPDPVFFQFNDFGKGIEQLEEVLLETKVDPILVRERSLSKSAHSKVDVLSEEDKNMFQFLGNYLISQGFRVTESPLAFKVVSSLAIGGGGDGFSGTGSPVTIYLDGVPIFDTTMFYRYPLSTIDYIEINKSGMGEGFMGSAGTIKIHSDFDLSPDKVSTKNRIQKFEFPVAYAVQKEFYVPKYTNTNDEFFQQYGVIDWKSDLIAGIGENIAIEFAKPKVDFKLIIEGFTAGGDLINEVRSISIN
ncbi:hypothetical protein C8P64_1230 [Christiangramia gaetbulicola]|uniref:TonB-dependent receptor-like protein n=1 Tax=Christiangramia gaetbulicola TaxID=703340 RepID=A0A2T6AN52_9FLAO|nr:hypothetical protein [Christiangramia gaetbulicola]PTX45238.1 hypothetical protein C8P64_1230 [Christiangramia gaetbulicola]